MYIIVIGKVDDLDENKKIVRGSWDGHHVATFKSRGCCQRKKPLDLCKHWRITTKEISRVERQFHCLSMMFERKRAVVIAI